MSVHSMFLNLITFCMLMWMHPHHNRREQCTTWSHSTTPWICLQSLVHTSFLDAFTPMVVVISYFITRVDVINYKTWIQSKMNIHNFNGTYGWILILPQKMVVWNADAGISFECIQVPADSGDHLQNGMQIVVITFNPSKCLWNGSLN